jgi:hypothetical protein
VRRPNVHEVRFVISAFILSLWRVCHPRACCGFLHPHSVDFCIRRRGAIRMSCRPQRGEEKEPLVQGSRLSVTSAASTEKFKTIISISAALAPFLWCDRNQTTPVFWLLTKPHAVSLAQLKATHVKFPSSTALSRTALETGVSGTLCLQSLLLFHQCLGKTVPSSPLSLLSASWPPRPLYALPATSANLSEVNTATVAHPYVLAASLLTMSGSLIVADLARLVRPRK